LATVTVNAYFLLKCLGLALARSWFRQPPILNHQVACLAADHEAQRKYGERLMWLLWRIYDNLGHTRCKEQRR